MKHIIIFTAVLSLFFGCSCNGRHSFSHEETNSVYYWKTTFSPDSADIAFIRRHRIGRIYLRMFDVSVDNFAYGDKTVPNATLRIPYETYRILKDSLKDVEFIPVVYVTLDALKAAKGHEGRLARNIVTRVRNMCSYNELPNVKGLQLDCDWTASTEQSFFSLCDSARLEITGNKLVWHLSSTIRLHQLARECPPVDYGVLMVYNTGDFSNTDAANSILDEKDVKPYLEHLKGYPLHLDVAYPTYSWQLLFHKRRFAGILNGVDVTDTAQFKCDKTHNTYRCLEEMAYKNTIIRKGDIIRSETSAFQDIASVKTLIDKELANRRHSNILYHFDLQNFSKYSDNEIQNMLSFK